MERGLTRLLANQSAHSLIAAVALCRLIAPNEPLQMLMRFGVSLIVILCY